MTDRCCEIVDSIDCKAPPGYGALATEIVTCWGCGSDVCRTCSSIIRYAAPSWLGGTRLRRFCVGCQDTRRVGRAA